jgi:hypothetical protein
VSRIPPILTTELAADGLLDRKRWEEAIRGDSTCVKGKWDNDAVEVADAKLSRDFRGLAELISPGAQANHKSFSIEE